MPIYSAVNIPPLSFANTFGDWVVITNNLITQGNQFASNNFIKPTGTLYLSDPTLGLQVNSAAIFASLLSVVGTGSSASIQNGLTVGGQVFFTNTITGLVNSGSATVNGQLLANGSGTGLLVSNNASISGTLTANGSVSFIGSLSVRGNTVFANSVNITRDLYSNNYTANSTVTTPALIVTGATLSAAAAAASFSSINVSGAATVGGNFIINGSTVNNSNTFTLNAASGAPGTNSFYSVYRTAGANASIRWNDTAAYWDMLNVASSIYSRVVTTEILSSVTNSTSTTLPASVAGVNSAIVFANVAFGVANSALQRTGGTVTGNTTHTAPLIINGLYANTLPIINNNGTWVGPGLPVSTSLLGANTQLFPMAVTTQSGNNQTAFSTNTISIFGTTTTLAGFLVLPGSISATSGNFSVNTGVAALSLDVNGNTRFGITGSGKSALGSYPDGRVFTTNIHNNANSASGTVEQFLASGTYNPNYSAGTNIAGFSSSGLVNWMRVGNVVTISGSVTIAASVNSTLTTLNVSLALLSNFTQAGASGVLCGIFGTIGQVGASSANPNLITLSYISNAIGSEFFTWTAQYNVS